MNHQTKQTKEEKEKAKALQRKPNRVARDRTGFLFNPGDPQEPVDPERDLTDGTVYQVVRWSISRPCLVVTGESVTLCGKRTADAESVSSRPASTRETYCAACLSKSGRGVVR